MSVFLAIPNMGLICTPLARRLYYRQWKVERVYDPERLQPVSYARNCCVEEFLRTGCDYLWFVDADTVPPTDALERLLEAGCPYICAAVRTLKQDSDGVTKPVTMLCQRREDGGFYEAQGSGVVPIHRSGMACALIRRDCFSMMEKPWFRSGDWGEHRGEDFAFCERLEAAGIPLCGHLGVVCMHRVEGWV